MAVGVSERTITNILGEGKSTDSKFNLNLRIKTAENVQRSWNWTTLTLMLYVQLFGITN